MFTGPPIQELLPTVRTMKKHVLDTYQDASRAERKEGSAWYDLAHLFADQISLGSPDQGAGVIAALSPQKRWDDNAVLARRAFENGKASGHVTNAVRKANLILQGASPLDVLGGSKVRSFYSLIADPSDPSEVCVDRHAFDVAIGKVTDDDARRILERSGGYQFIADVYRKVAHKLEILPSRVQAVTWIHWRNTK